MTYVPTKNRLNYVPCFVQNPKLKQRLTELKPYKERIIHYTIQVKENIGEIEKVLGLVYNDLDSELTHTLTLFLTSLKDWQWESSINESELVTFSMMHPNASNLFSKLKEIYDKLEAIGKTKN